MNQIETKEISFYINSNVGNMSNRHSKVNSSKPQSSLHRSSTKFLPQISSVSQTRQRNLYSPVTLSKEEFIQKYLNKKRKTTMIISKYLDEDLRKRLEKLKYTFKSKEKLTNASQLNESKNWDEYQNHESHVYAHEPTSMLIDTSLCTSNESLINYTLKQFKRRNNDITKSKNLSFKTTEENLEKQRDQSKTIRFGSTLSRDGQFALLKSLEDQIIQEIRSVYPHLDDNQIPRISTPNYLKMISTNTFDKSDYDEEDYDYQYEQKLMVTQSIESAMDILDHLRHKKKLNQQEQDDLLGDISQIDLDLDEEYLKMRKRKVRQTSFQTGRNSAVTDPFLKYSAWCNEWIQQLENI